MRKRRHEQLATRLVGHKHIGLLRRPVNAGVPTTHAYLLSVSSPSQRPDPEVPLRLLIDKALNQGYVLLPLAAPHHRRDGPVFGGPSTQGQALKAISRRRSRQPEMAYEH
jgi:hypothetical protein